MLMEDQDRLAYAQHTMVKAIAESGDICAVIDFKGDSYILKATLTPFIEGKPYQDRDWLVEQYTKKEMTMAELATLCGCTAATINQWLVRYQIPTRSRGRR